MPKTQWKPREARKALLNLSLFYQSQVIPGGYYEQIWEYAKQNDLAIVTKDADFSDRFMVDSSPPRVIHLRFGNMKKRVFHAFLASVWPKIEALMVDYKLINVYLNRIEAVK
jgi:predicted nuclease of predicted toxin-antitoxin system